MAEHNHGRLAGEEAKYEACGASHKKRGTAKEKQLGNSLSTAKQTPVGSRKLCVRQRVSNQDPLEVFRVCEVL